MQGKQNQSPERFPTVWLFCYLSIYTIATNIPFWIACRWLDLLPIGWFSLQSLIAGVIALFLSRRLAALFLLLTFAEDILCAVSKTYYLAPTFALSHAWTLRDFPLSRLLLFSAVIVASLVIFCMIAAFPTQPIRQSRSRLAAVIGLCVFAGFGLAVDSWSIQRSIGRFTNPLSSGRAGDQNRFSTYSALWFFRYSSLRLRATEMLFSPVPEGSWQDLSKFRPMASATAVALQQSAVLAGPKTLQPNVVVIVVESWGLALDASLHDILDRYYSQSGITQRYEVRQGATPFTGSTVNGEVRELCGSSLGFSIERATADQLHGCLPDKLEALGYHTAALHGMGGNLFLRSNWYKQLGFQDIWFRQKFLDAGLPDCVGAFRGICDPAIADWIGQSLQKPSAQPSYIHWMTLNTHLPLPVPSGLRSPASCSVYPLISQLPAFCSWYQFQDALHASIAKLAMSDLNRPTIFVIVGDHAPPFANATIRSQFSQSQVPYVLLLPRASKADEPGTSRPLKH